MTNSHDPTIEAWQAPGFESVLAGLLSERTVYIVGGNVRDYLMGRAGAVTDLDLVMAGPVLNLARRVADQIGWAYYPLDESRDVARLVKINDNGTRLECDISALRGDLTHDLQSRDFTLNSLALELYRDHPPRLIDLSGGVDDLAAHRLRTLDPANLDQDPVRMLRAVRLSHKLGLTIAPELREQIHARTESIRGVSHERVRDELWKMLSATQPGAVMETLRELGLLVQVLPELAGTVGVTQSPPHHLDVYDHTRLVMDNAAHLRDWLIDASVPLEPSLAEMLVHWRAELSAHFAEALTTGHSRADWLVWHALFHDTGKPATRTEEISEEGTLRYRFLDHETVSADLAEARLSQLRFSRREVMVCKSVLADHMRPHNLVSSFGVRAINRRSAHRFFRDTGSGLTGPRTGVDVLLLALADRHAIGKNLGEVWARYVEQVNGLLAFTFANVAATRPPLITGSTLIQHFNLKPGRQIGELLEQLSEAQAVGEIGNTDEALALAAQLLDLSPPQAERARSS